MGVGAGERQQEGKRRGPAAVALRPSTCTPVRCALQGNWTHLAAHAICVQQGGAAGAPQVHPLGAAAAHAAGVDDARGAAGAHAVEHGSSRAAHAASVYQAGGAALLLRVNHAGRAVVRQLQTRRGGGQRAMVSEVASKALHDYMKSRLQGSRKPLLKLPATMPDTSHHIVPGSTRR